MGESHAESWTTGFVAARSKSRGEMRKMEELDGKAGNRRSTQLNMYIVLMAVISILLSRMGFGTFIYGIPLLIISTSIKRGRNAALYFLAVGLVVLFWKVFDYRGIVDLGAALRGSEETGLLVVGLVFNLMVTASLVTWAALRDKVRNVLRRLLACSVVVAVIGLLFVLWANVFATEAQISEIIALYQAAIPKAIVSEEYAAQLSQLVFTVIMLTVVPFGMFFSSFQILVSEFIIHKTDSSWQRSFSLIKLPDRYLWMYIATLVLSGVFSFAGSVPAVLKAVFFNIALAFSLHYLLVGISILFFYMRRKNEAFTAGKAFAIVFVSMLIPFLNMFVFVSLICLSVSETWLKFRARNA